MRMRVNHDFSGSLEGLGGAWRGEEGWGKVEEVEEGIQMWLEDFKVFQGIEGLRVIWGI